MMNLDEAIYYCEDVAEHQRRYAELFMKSSNCQGEADACTRSAERFSAIAEWLKELKTLRADRPSGAQINADERSQCVERVETMSCQECKHWVELSPVDGRCDLVYTVLDCRYEPRDELQTEGAESERQQ